jgi:hypothetical protein
MRYACLTTGRAESDHHTTFAHCWSFLMMSSASALLLAAVVAPVAPAAADITPVSLAVLPPVTEPAAAPYDWTLQQARRAAGVRLADGTANCNTQMASTNHNGQTDNIPDCNFD